MADYSRFLDHILKRVREEFDHLQTGGNLGFYLPKEQVVATVKTTDDGDVDITICHGVEIVELEEDG